MTQLINEVKTILDNMEITSLDSNIKGVLKIKDGHHDKVYNTLEAEYREEKESIFTP
jgi:hypothetical protein